MVKAPAIEELVRLLGGFSVSQRGCCQRHGGISEGYITLCPRMCPHMPPAVNGCPQTPADIETIKNPHCCGLFELQRTSLEVYVVPTVGLEPTQLSPPPPQDGVSTNSTTSAADDHYSGKSSGLEPDSGGT